jgi:hypothetical protein
LRRHPPSRTVAVPMARSQPPHKRQSPTAPGAAAPLRVERPRPRDEAPELPAPLPVAWVKRAVAVVLLPCCWIATAALFEVFRASGARTLWHSPEVWLFSAGCLLWLAWWFFLPRPTALYVLGHEHTHALFIRLSGGRVGRVHATGTGGYVLTDKSNFLIALAPYFVPILTLLSLALLGVAGLLVEIPWFDRLLFFTTGFTWAFHITFTLAMIGKGQSDIDDHGRFFSLTFIYLANVLTIAALLMVASPRVSLAGFGRAAWDEAARLARTAASILGPD